MALNLFPSPSSPSHRTEESCKDVPTEELWKNFTPSLLRRNPTLPGRKSFVERHGLG